MPSLPDNIRPNLAGDYPKIHPTALIDPSAQIIGNVQIARDVFVGPLTVIRSDHRGPDGKVEPIVIQEEVNIQDGVIIHSHFGDTVIIGAKSSIAHGVAIHGPSTIGESCFLAIRSVLYMSTIEDSVWVGMGALVMRATLPPFIMVPAGSVIRGRPDTLGLQPLTDKEKEYMEGVWAENSRLRRDYLEQRNRMESLKETARTVSEKKDP
jgi:carbonic anhydrase